MAVFLEFWVPTWGYLCMCEPYRGAQNQPWRCNRGAYGIHVPHLGGRKKLPFLDTGNFHKRQVAKKGMFWASPEWGTWSPHAPPSHLQGCPGAPPHRSHMQRYGDSGYLCMCQPYGGGKNDPWRCDGGAYGLHAPHSGEAQQLPFLAIRKVPKKAVFAPPPNGGHGARMRPPYISRADFGHPGRADTCRDTAI